MEWRSGVKAMTLSEAIEALEKIRAEFDDIPVGWDYDGLQCFKDAQFHVTGPGRPRELSLYDDGEKKFMAGRLGVLIYSVDD